MTGWRNDPRATAVLDAGELLYLAVPSRWGPHVTPYAFEHDSGRLWFITSRRSVKARVIAENPVVGGLVRSGERAVMLIGRARIVDPFTARGLGFRLLDLPLALTGYVSRNFRHATGVLLDRPVPTLALARVLIAVDLTGMALLDGPSVAMAGGRWARRDLLLRGFPLTGHPPTLGGVPSQLRALLSGPSPPIVLGWQTLSGPVALPACWNGDQSELVTSAAAMVLAGAPSHSLSCLAVSRGGYRLRTKQGLLLQGTGRASVEDQAVRVIVEPERLTYWVGEESRTVIARPTPLGGQLDTHGGA